MTAAPFQPKVLIVPASYFARNRTVGGGERYAFEYARAMAALTPTTLGLFDETVGVGTDGPLTIRRFAVRGFNERWWFPATAATRAALGGFDILHAMDFPTPLADLLALLARWRRRKFILTDVGGGGVCWSTRLRYRVPRLDLNRLAHGLALISNYSAGFFQDWGQPREILHGGVRKAELPPAPSGSSNDGAGAYALFVGRLLPHKGVLQLVESIDADTPLHVVGRPYDTAYVDAVRKAASGKRVSFVFDADDTELRRQYNGARVVLQPSIPSGDVSRDKSELLGLVAIEAMASGKPVIVTRTASLPETVVEGETGLVVPPHDREALRGAIGRFMGDSALALRVGLAARRHVEQRFTWESAAQRGLDLYRRVLAS